MEILSEIDVMGSSLVDDNVRERSVKYPEVNTLTTIRDIEKSLEANLQECMNFLQVLTEDNSRKGATTEWVNKDMHGSQELEIFHATRPNTAPPKSTSHTHEHLELAQRVSYEFDDTTVVSDSSCESNKPRFQTVSEVDLEWDTAALRNMTASKGHAHHDCCSTKTDPRNLLHVHGRIRTWSTEPISETPTPKSVISSTCSPNDKVSVCVRMRPFNEHEKVCPLKQVLCSQKDKVIVKDYNYLRQGNPTNTKTESQFYVDNVLDDSFLPRGNRQRKEESQRCMFEILGKPCVENALDSCNTTIMAYGQMGSGKTYTMMGDGTLCGRGLVPRIVHELMRRVQEDRKIGVCFSVQVSYLEIYQEKVRDLLVDKKVEHREDENCSFRSRAESPLENGRGPSFSFHGPVKKDHLRVLEHPVTGPFVEGLIWKDVTTCGEMDKLVKLGAANRTLGTTNTHVRISSRGHTLFTIKIIKMQMNDKSNGTSTGHINLNSSSRNVFTNLSSGRSNGKFASYRSSALTWLLRESLCGSSKTFLVASISPAEQDFQESVHTLRCTAKAKRIKGPPLDQDLETKKQIFMKMDEEMRTLHYLIADLTKNSTQKSSTGPLKQVKKLADEVEQLSPTRETGGRRSLQENVVQIRPSSRHQKAKPLHSGAKKDAKERFYVHTKI